jgi:hypothetical protein
LGKEWTIMIAERNDVTESTRPLRRALAAGCLVLAALAPAGAPARAGDGPRDRGKKGDFVGVWEALDVRTRKPAFVAEFKENGGCDLNDGGTVTARYRFDDPALSLWLVPPQGTPILWQQGTVDWVSGSLFKYKLGAVGANRAHWGREYEFYRQSGPEGEKDFENLIGTWKRTDPGTYAVTRTIELRSDGTVREAGRPYVNDTDGGRWCFRYKARILSFVYVYPDGREDRGERGRVEWDKDDHFKLKVLESPFRYDLRGKVCEFRRVARGPSRPRPAEAPARGAAPAGRKGDLVGLWEARDVRVRHSARVVAFHKDGNYEMTDEQGRHGEGRYRATAAGLEFIFRIPGGGLRPDHEVVQERGTVEWVDGRLFKYKVTYGYRNGRSQAGREYEFARQTHPDGERDADNLVGSWRRTDPEGAAPPSVLNLCKDGTYDEGGRLDVDPSRYGGYYFRYKDHLLTLVYRYADGKEMIMERGRVGWVTEDHFTFKVLDGARVPVGRRGTVYELRRERRSP